MTYTIHYIKEQFYMTKLPVQILVPENSVRQRVEPSVQFQVLQRNGCLTTYASEQHIYQLTTHISIEFSLTNSLTKSGRMKLLQSEFRSFAIFVSVLNESNTLRQTWVFKCLSNTHSISSMPKQTSSQCKNQTFTISLLLTLSVSCIFR